LLTIGIRVAPVGSVGVADAIAGLMAISDAAAAINAACVNSVISPASLISLRRAVAVVHVTARGVLDPNHS
jgi:hypothetical protein